MSNNELIKISEKDSETVEVTREEYSKVYEAGEPSVEEWKNRFEELVAENQKQINWFFEKAALLYAAEKPDHINVALIFNPNEGNVKGEPIDNLEPVNPDLANTTDVIYWVPKPDTYMMASEQMTIQVKGILHEGEHRYYQGVNGILHEGGFNAFLAEIDNDPEVIELRQNVFGKNSGYLELTNELLTVYLESLYDISVNKDEAPNTKVEFSTNEEQSFAILLAAMQSHDLRYSETSSQQGPYSNIIKGYRRLSSQVLGKDIVETKPVEINEATGGAKSGDIKQSPYDFRGSLPTTLLERYVEDNKPIDREFIVSLYKMALSYSKEQ